MTREEISERAARLTMRVALNLTGSAEDMIGAATDEMVDFYRATLQEAARAVCRRCSSDVPIREISWYYHGDRIGCDASSIHDLIAALAEEGS